VLVCLVIFLVVSMNMDIIKHFLQNKAYWEGLIIVPILLMANLFLGIYYNLAIWFKLTDKTYWGIYISLFGATVTIVGNIILIPVMGYVGAAWATCLCYALMAVISFLIGQKFYPIPYQAIKMAFWIVSAVIVLKGFELLSFPDGWFKEIAANMIILIWAVSILLLEKHKNRSKAK